MHLKCEIKKKISHQIPGSGSALALNAGPWVCIETSVDLQHNTAFNNDSVLFCPPVAKLFS